MRGLVLVLFLIGMAMATTASAQMEPTEAGGDAPTAEDDSSDLEYFAAGAEDPLLAEVLAMARAEEMEAASSAEILYGRLCLRLLLHQLLRRPGEVRRAGPRRQTAFGPVRHRFDLATRSAGHSVAIGR
jgi:hypothetical protein